MAVGLENPTRTSVMPRIISRINLLQLFLRVCYCRDHRYLVFMNPFVTGGTYICHLKRVFSSPLGYQYPSFSPCCHLEVSLFRWTSQNAFSRETAVYKWYCVQCCKFSSCCHVPWSFSIPLNQSECTFPRNSSVQMILCAMLHVALHAVGYCYPSRLEKTFCKFDIRVYVLLAAKGLIHITATVNRGLVV